MIVTSAILFGIAGAVVGLLGVAVWVDAEARLKGAQRCIARQKQFRKRPRRDGSGRFVKVPLVERDVIMAEAARKHAA